MESSAAGETQPAPRDTESHGDMNIGKLWWLWLVAGVAWIVIALVILQFDDASITTVGVLIGIMFLLSGFQQFFMGALVGGWIQIVMWIFGVLFVVAGIIALISPENTFAAIADILGFLFLLVGIFWIIQAFADRDVSDLWWLGLISGVLMIILVGVFWTIQAFVDKDVNELWWLGLISGVLMIILAFWTGGQFFIDKAYVLLVFAGIWALMHGVGDIVRAFQLRSLKNLAE
jgi:uncharacterized membrane protein HdeD (DUF308 family)